MQSVVNKGTAIFLAPVFTHTIRSEQTPRDGFPGPYLVELGVIQVPSILTLKKPQKVKMEGFFNKHRSGRLSREFRLLDWRPAVLRSLGNMEVQTGSRTSVACTPTDLQNVLEAHLSFSGVTLRGSCGPLFSSPSTTGMSTPGLHLLTPGAPSGRANSKFLMSVTKNICISMTLLILRASVLLSGGTKDHERKSPSDAGSNTS